MSVELCVQLAGTSLGRLPKHLPLHLTTEPMHLARIPSHHKLAPGVHVLTPGSHIVDPRAAKVQIELCRGLDERLTLAMISAQNGQIAKNTNRGRHFVKILDVLMVLMKSEIC